MLDHDTPSLRRFACKARPFLKWISYPGSVSRTIQGPPPCPEPLCRLRRYLFRRDVFCTRQQGRYPPSSLLRTHAPVQYSPVLFRFPLFDGSLQVVTSPAAHWTSRCYLLRSFRRCLDPYPVVSWCSYPFFPWNPRLLQPFTGSTSHYAPRKATSHGTRFRGCSHSLCSDSHVCSSPSRSYLIPWQL